MRPKPSDVTVWDDLADGYGAQERLERRAVATAVRLAGLTAADTLVDLATGTGIVLHAAAATTSPPQVGIGVDRAPRMLAGVGALPAGWRTVAADARAVPVHDDAADVVTASFLLHLLDTADRAAVLAEARRLLRPAPSSRLVTVTVWTGARPGARAAGAVLGALAAARPATLGGLRPLDPTADLRAAGFVVERRAELPRGGYPALVLRARPG